ncbi:MAG TPA: patatin-like phospholipase family protein [Solirubrobacteraceae bacterium]|nr:patatin-like phospholipase family protein [Solirubrobacteraceae bacterium]
MVPDVDIYNLKRNIERANELLDLGRASTGLSFLNHARQVLMPLPLVDRSRPAQTDIFPPVRMRPVAALQGKRIGVIASGGGGGCVAMVGVARAFEEAGVRPALYSACSGSAIWGAMWAAGMSAQEMVDFSLSWRAEDYLDIRWTGIPRFLLSGLKGFTGLMKGAALERLFNERLWNMRVGDTAFPMSSIGYNMDLGRVEYFSSEQTPELTLGELVRIAVALPLFIESVPVGGHLYVDGGVIELFPAQPILEDGELDHVFGVNFMLPAGFEAQDITGWAERPGGFLQASRQLQQGNHLEMARRARRELGERFTLIDPIDPALLRGVSFYDLFIDRRRWPELIRQGHAAATRALDALRASRPRSIRTARQPHVRPLRASTARRTRAARQSRSRAA